MTRKINFMDTTLRDAHQSLLATRVSTKEMLPILDKIDKVGYSALEVWGGATFDSCLRFLNEDPWERLRTIRKNVKNAKLQMLLRGQNILGYKHYPDDILELFVQKAVENGIDIIRTFDALNDVRNLRKSIEFGKKYGAHVQGAISYTISPFHTVEYYLDLVGNFMEMEVDSICIKDMAGLLTPKMAYEMVKMIKQKYDITIQMHTHCTVGTGQLTYLAAMEGGADIFDTATASLSGASSQPPVETMYYAFREYEDLELSLKPEYFIPISDYFEKIREKHQKVDAGIKHINLRVLSSQVPGGMLSNLMNQLREQGKLDKLNEVLEEIPTVRKDLGYPPLVTPTSQIVGVQAVLNVLMGRYKKITREVKAYIHGYYGKSPAPLNPELVDRVSDGTEEFITCRPADLIKPQVEELRKNAANIAKSDEDLLSFALFGEVAAKRLKDIYFASINLDKDILDELEENGGGIYPVG